MNLERNKNHAHLHFKYHEDLESFPKSQTPVEHNESADGIRVCGEYPALERSDPLIEIYADGSFDPEARAGGWAFIAYNEGCEVHSGRGAGRGGTNNTFELLAIMQAAIWARDAGRATPVHLWTDSRYVMEGCHRWLPIWRTNGWKKIDPNSRRRRRTVPDAEIWKRVDQVLAEGGFTIDWCKAHCGRGGNEAADRLAAASRLSLSTYGADGVRG